MLGNYIPLFNDLSCDAHTRLDLIRSFISYWYDPIREGNGYTEEEIKIKESQLRTPIPAILREFYLLFGKREILPFIYSLHNLRWAFGKSDILFCEGPSLIDAACFPSSVTKFVDPPVYDSFEGETLVSDQLSTFLIKLLLRETNGPYGSWLNQNQDDYTVLQSELHMHFTQCDLSPPYLEGQRFLYYEGRNLIATIREEDKHILIQARTRDAMLTFSREARECLSFVNSSMRYSWLLLEK